MFVVRDASGRTVARPHGAEAAHRWSRRADAVGGSVERNRAGDEADLAWLLRPMNEAKMGLGTERSVKLRGAGPRAAMERGFAVRLYVDQYGSHRFVAYRKGEPIAGLQVMVRPERAVVANVYSAPGVRGTGVASKLFAVARKHLGAIEHSEHLTEAGAKFAERNRAGKKRLNALAIKGIADQCLGAARENAAQSVFENHPREEYDEYTDSHPKWEDYFNATLEGCLNSLQSPREYSSYAPRELTSSEIERVRKAILAQGYGHSSSVLPDKPKKSRRSKPARADVEQTWRRFGHDAVALSDLNQLLRESGFAAITEEEAAVLGLSPRRRLSAAGAVRNIVVGLTPEAVAGYWAFADERERDVGDQRLTVADVDEAVRAIADSARASMRSVGIRPDTEEGDAAEPYHVETVLATMNWQRDYDGLGLDRPPSRLDIDRIGRAVVAAYANFRPLSW